jgi:hypothetical protein
MGTGDRRQEARAVHVLCGGVDAKPREQFKSNSTVEKHSADGVGSADIERMKTDKARMQRERSGRERVSERRRKQGLTRTAWFG